jgi:hypothetical protein
MKWIPPGGYGEAKKSKSKMTGFFGKLKHRAPNALESDGGKAFFLRYPGPI